MRQHIVLIVRLCFAALLAPVVATGALAASPTPTGAAATVCDQTCLQGFVDEYLAALVAHAPKSLPLSGNVRFTENTVRLNLGEGLWSDATGIGQKKIYITDPDSGQAGFMGVVMEKGEPRLLALRLKIHAGKISEIETIVARTGLAGPFKPEMAKQQAKPIWGEELQPSERVSREEMIKAATAYFDGMERNSGANVPFDPSCNRTENGLQTTNNPSLPPMNGVNFGAMGCKAQFNHGGVGIYTTPERRFWMVDQKRGIVIGVFVFTVKASFVSIPITEAFKIKNGRIYEIEAIGVTGPGMPYGSRTGW